MNVMFIRPIIYFSISRKFRALEGGNRHDHHDHHSPLFPFEVPARLAWNTHVRRKLEHPQTGHRTGWRRLRCPGDAPAWGWWAVRGRTRSRCRATATLATVIAKYCSYILARPDLMAALADLRGKDLACWYAPERYATLIC
jgi:hypothetical protein